MVKIKHNLKSLFMVILSCFLAVNAPLTAEAEETVTEETSEVIAEEMTSETEGQITENETVVSDEIEIVEEQEEGSLETASEEKEEEKLVDVPAVIEVTAEEETDEMSDAVEVPAEDIQETDEIFDEEASDVYGVSITGGSSMAEAVGIAFGASYSDVITESTKAKYYKVTLPSAGRITITSTAQMQYIRYGLFDSDAKELWNDYFYWNTTSQVSNVTKTFDLTKGTYYFVASKYSSYTGSYSFNILFESAGETYTEKNDSMNNPYSLSFDTTYKGQIATNDNKDFYKFDISTSGRITITATAAMQYITYGIYDINGKEIWNDYYYWNSSTSISSVTKKLDLVKGTYYFVASKYSSYTGNYSFDITFESAGETFTEKNDAMNDPYDISFGTSYKGQLAINDNQDFYRFDLDSTGKLTVTASAKMNYISYGIYDSNGAKIWSNYYYWNTSTNISNMAYTTDLSKGTYYFVVSKYSDYTGNYTFDVNFRSNSYMNGLIQDDDGVWKLFQAGDVRTSFTGLYPLGTSLFYLTNGILDKSVNGIYYSQNKPYYVVNGQVTFNYTGLGEYKGSLFYFTNSVKDETFNGIAYYRGTPYYVVDGKVTFNYNGLGEYKGSLHYFTNSKKDTSFTGISYYRNVPYYVLNGVVSYNYTGLGKYKNDWWYIVNSRVNKSFSGKYKWKNRTYTIKNGKVVG